MSVTGTKVGSYTLLLDRMFDPENHFWVEVLPPSPTRGSRVRVGMDPLGVEVSGTIAQLAFAPLGSTVRRGEPFGNLEAAKFVGPLVAPISGNVVAHNDAVLANPGLVERDPFGAGWLVDIDAADLAAESAFLLQGTERVLPWFERKIKEYRLKGVLAQ